MPPFQCRRRSYNPGRCRRQPRFGLLRVRSPLLAQSFLLSLPPGTKMFQFPGFAPGFTPGVGIPPDGFPHSDIRGSQGICPSPRLFAAYHVLLRLREPQASPVRPCSLSSCLRDRSRTHSRATRPVRRAAGRAVPDAYIRLARFFPILSVKSLDFSRFAFPPCQ